MRKEKPKFKNFLCLYFETETVEMMMYGCFTKANNVFVFHLGFVTFGKSYKRET